MSDDGELEPPTGMDDTHIGAGVFDETMGPGPPFAHLYRGEIHRMKSWRERLDRTSNWAITLMAGILTWSFSAQTHPHYLILLGAVTLSILLSTEVRHFRAYDVWRSRVRLIQQNVWAYALSPDGGILDENWREKLGEDYHTSNMKIPFEEALTHRLRRVYLPLFLVMLAAWVIQLTTYTDGTTPVGSAGIGGVPGNIIIAFVAGFYTTLFGISFRPRKQHVNGEFIPSNVTGWEELKYGGSQRRNPEWFFRSCTSVESRRLSSDWESTRLKIELFPVQIQETASGFYAVLTREWYELD